MVKLTESTTGSRPLRKVSKDKTLEPVWRCMISFPLFASGFSASFRLKFKITRYYQNLNICELLVDKFPINGVPEKLL